MIWRSRAFQRLLASFSLALEAFREATALALSLAATPFTTDLGAESLGPWVLAGKAGSSLQAVFLQLQEAAVSSILKLAGQCRLVPSGTLLLARKNALALRSVPGDWAGTQIASAGGGKSMRLWAVEPGGP